VEINSNLFRLIRSD